MFSNSREQFLRANAHLWGKVDPIDGIPYRPPADMPVEPKKKLPQLHKPDMRSIYEESDRSGLVVRVRWFGVLINLGCHETKALAMAARDEFIEAHSCPSCGEKWREGEERPVCCLMYLYSREEHQEILATA